MERNDETSDEKRSKTCLLQSQYNGDKFIVMIAWYYQQTLITFFLMSCLYYVWHNLSNQMNRVHMERTKTIVM